MPHSSKTAFCPLYFRAHGGRFTDKGNPIFEDKVPGLCDRAFDCGTCSLMVNWVPEMAGWSTGWECDKCLKETFFEDKKRKVQRWLPGFYQSGSLEEQEVAPIAGCTRCGWQSSFLQIILRRQHG